MLKPQRADVTGDWRKLRNEELHDMQLLIKFHDVGRVYSTRGRD
jgi:hypothetical protein